MAAAARFLIGTFAATLWLGGCVAPPPSRPEVELTQVVAGSPDAVLPRAEAALASLGLTVVEVDPAAGRLQAQRRDLSETSWADCPEPVVYDPDGDRRRRAAARALDVDLVMSASLQQDGSAVAVQPRFERTYLNSFTNLEFTRRCRSTGALERAIFERLQVPSASRHPLPPRVREGKPVELARATGRRGAYRRQNQSGASVAAAWIA